MANTVYWVGRNGNVYFRSGDKVTDAGKLIKDFGNGEFNKKDLVNYVENEVLDMIRKKAK